MVREVSTLLVKGRVRAWAWKREVRLRRSCDENRVETESEKAQNRSRRR